MARCRTTEPTLADEIAEGLRNAIRYAKGDKSAGIEHRVETSEQRHTD